MERLLFQGVQIVDSLYISLPGTSDRQGIDRMMAMIHPFGPVRNPLDGDYPAVHLALHLLRKSGIPVPLEVQVVQHVVPSPNMTQQIGDAAARGIDMTTHRLQHLFRFSCDILALAQLPLVA